ALLGRIGESSRTSGRAHRSPVNVIAPNGCPSIAATVSASSGASAGPSTVPHNTPEAVDAEPGWTKRAIRTMAKVTGAPGTGCAQAAGGHGVAGHRRRA